MSEDYSVEVCRQLAEAYARTGVLRPMRVQRYDPGQELTYDMTGVWPAWRGAVSIRVEKFIGGGFAGQVYRSTVTSAAPAALGPGGLRIGQRCALKVLVPPSRFARLFRDAVYWLGFQSPFQPQVNPAAARAGALWQKFIRRAAATRFGTEKAVRDVYATFVDATLGGCGELAEWIEGRIWRFEVDDRLFRRWAWGSKAHEEDPSSEYLAKKRFMGEMVRLLHELGAPELARQYEWWTCKSQPNVLKRTDGAGGSGDGPGEGLTALDFRAGLALLPCLPMSPGDVGLIVRGLRRGRIVQFDRGDLARLEAFVEGRRGQFSDAADPSRDMPAAVEDLRSAERQYRDAQVDLTHHHVRLLYDFRLWESIRQGAITGWRVRNLIDDAAERSLRAGRIRSLVFCLLGLLPLLGRAARKLWGRADYRSHCARLLTSPRYSARAFRAHVAEKLIGWHRGGRISAAAARSMCDRPILFLLHLPLRILPAFMHRMLTDRAYALDRLKHAFVRPVRLYFNAEARKQWLRDMVAHGQSSHMVSDQDAREILAHIDEPFIQKYLMSLVVHLCTLPVTQLVSAGLALWYYLAHPEMPPSQRAAVCGAIMVLFQVIPISPGSFCRGLYVLYLVIRERNFRDYDIAVFLGFFKYVGYLAFPIQMAYRYPALARFMAGQAATGIVHVVPVFGERGALLEHFIFDLFYNYPLTIRRRMARRAERRRAIAPRRWHALVCLAFAAAALTAIDLAGWRLHGAVPTLRQAWALAIWPPLLAGAGAALWAGGLAAGRRIILGTLTGLAVGAACAGIDLGMTRLAGAPRTAHEVLEGASWSAFIFAILGGLGAIIAETHAPEPG